MPRLLIPAFLLVLFFSAAAHADPLVITSGSFTAVGQSLGSKHIAIFGPGFHFSSSSPYTTGLPGSDLVPGGGARTLRVIGNFDSGSFAFDMGSVNFPDLGDIDPTNVTFTVPFNMEGRFFGQVDGEPTPRQVFVVGRGDMTFNYLAHPDHNGRTLYEFQSLRATFADAATPEPATLTLFGLGGAGAWLLRRRRAKG